MRMVGGLLLVLVGCATPGRLPSAPDARPHLGDEWFAWRAGTLGLSVEETRARDASLPAGEEGRVPPDGTLDEHTAAEAALLWQQECARCHGSTGAPPPVEPGRTPPRAWGGMGVRMGFLFGGDKMRAGIYRAIAQGKGDMAAWGDTLSREQIWALVRHIERF